MYAFSMTLYSEQLKIVYHVNEKEKMPMLISSIKEILKIDNNAEIKAVIHGSAIYKLSKRDKKSDQIKQLINNGVEIGLVV